MTRFHRWFLYGSTIATALSGIAYFVMKRFLESDDPWAVINHPLEPWALKAHILSAPLMLFAVGLIATHHIWRSLRSRLPTGRRSGLIASYAAGPLVVSGYLIQVITSPPTLEILAWAHLVLGVGVATAIGLHRAVLHGRRRQRKGALPVVQLPAEPNQLEVHVGPAQVPVGRRLERVSDIEDLVVREEVPY